ncbi:hypothetical protein FACHB389_05185 [Nostoc calcicola FACHB-389]|nr:hypothetical protein FACHB389_05185 [Nostoc calcicola FACHB-389]
MFLFFCDQSTAKHGNQQTPAQVHSVNSLEKFPYLLAKLGMATQLLTPALGKILEIADFIQHSARSDTGKLI